MSSTPAISVRSSDACSAQAELRDVKLVPLDLFDRSEAEVNELFAGEYAGFAAPKVVRKLAFVSKSFIDQEKSPEQWP